MWLLVNSYSVSWRSVDGVGAIHLQFHDNSMATVQPSTIMEATGLTDLLRNESPVWFNTESQDLQTGWEPVGDGEKHAFRDEASLTIDADAPGIAETAFVGHGVTKCINGVCHVYCNSQWRKIANANCPTGASATVKCLHGQTWRLSGCVS